MSEAMRIDRMRETDVEVAASIDADAPVDPDHLREELARAWSRLWVVREGDTPIAFVASWHVSDELHVLNVATRADRRRRGVGRALMDEVVGYAQANGVQHVLLEVRRSNRAAIELYRRVGFFAMGIRSRYYPDDEDAVEMTLLLDPATRQVLAHEDEVRLDESAGVTPIGS